MKIQSPCQGCAQRAMSCHASCEKYKQYRNELDEMKRQSAHNSEHAAYRRNLRLFVFRKSHSGRD